MVVRHGVLLGAVVDVAESEPWPRDGVPGERLSRKDVKFVGKGMVQTTKWTRNSIRCAGEASCGLEYADEDEDAHWALGDPGHWRLSVCLPSVSTSEHWREWGGRAEGSRKVERREIREMKRGQR